MSSEFLFTGLSLDTLEEVVKAVDSLPVTNHNNNDVIAIFGDKSTTKVVNALIEGSPTFTKITSDPTPVKVNTTSSVQHSDSATIILPNSSNITAATLLQPVSTAVISNVPIAAANVETAQTLIPVVSNIAPATATVICPPCPVCVAPPTPTTTVVGPATNTTLGK